MLKVELIPFSRAFACLETLKTKMDFSCLICWKAPQGLWPPTKAVLISDGVLVTNA